MSVAAEHMQYPPCLYPCVRCLAIVSSIKPSNYLSVDQRRSQDLPMLVEVVEYLFPVHDSFRHPWRVSNCANQPRAIVSQRKPDYCLVQYCGQSRIARYCECQDELLRTRTCRPIFFPPLNTPAFSLPSTILGPTAHPRPSGFGLSTSSSQLHHLPPTLPLTHSTANSSLDAQPKRHACIRTPQLRRNLPGERGCVHEKLKVIAWEQGQRG